VAAAQTRTPSVRRAQQPLAQSAFWLQRAAQAQLAPMQVHAVGLRRPVVSRQQSASPEQVPPTGAKHAALLAQKRETLHARVPSLRGAQQPLTQSELLAHAAVQTVPTPVRRTQRVVTPRSAQQSASVAQVSPTWAKQAETQVPDGEQAWPPRQVPHEPVPQLSGPQLRPAQVGVQVGVHEPRTESQTSPAGQLPQMPPQPSVPQERPAQLGVQHWPVMALHEPPPAQVPHIPPQPSEPHMRPLHCGVQVLGAHAPALHAWPAGQPPQVPPQPLSPHTRPVQLGVHAASGVTVVPESTPESSTGQPAQASKPLPPALQVWTPIAPPGQRQAWVTPGTHPVVVVPPPEAGPHPTTAANSVNANETRIQKPMNIISNVK
jgi:hypothetical protein